MVYVLEEHGWSPILDYLGIFLQRIHSEINEFSIIAKKYGCWCFLVVTSIAGIEDLYS